MVRVAQPTPAEFTSARSGPISLASSMAAITSSVLVTSTGAKAPPISDARALPLSSCRSAMTTLAPRPASRRAQPSPIPEAPPVTMAEIPFSSMAVTLGRTRLRGRNRTERSSFRSGRPRPARPPSGGLPPGLPVLPAIGAPPRGRGRWIDQHRGQHEGAHLAAEPVDVVAQGAGDEQVQLGLAQQPGKGLVDAGAKRHLGRSGDHPGPEEVEHVAHDPALRVDPTPPG